MSAIYFDKYGWPAYVEDSRAKPRPEWVAGMTRHPAGLERVQPVDIVRAEREFKAMRS